MSGYADLLGLEPEAAPAQPNGAASKAPDPDPSSSHGSAGRDDGLPASSSAFASTGHSDAGRGARQDAIARRTVAFDAEREENAREAMAQQGPVKGPEQYWKRFEGVTDGADARYVMQSLPPGADRGAGRGVVREARHFVHLAKLRYYMAPPVEDQMVYCSLERHRGGRVTSFDLRRDDTGEFLLAASVAADLSGPVVFHTLQDSHLRGIEDIPSSRDSAVYLGCMVPNFFGTEFRIMDHRVDFRRTADINAAERTGLFELALIFYEVDDEEGRRQRPHASFQEFLGGFERVGSFCESFSVFWGAFLFRLSVYIHLDAEPLYIGCAESLCLPACSGPWGTFFFWCLPGLTRRAFEISRAAAAATCQNFLPQLFVLTLSRYW
ncbi:unnamed protein product [Phaeothamnion confervicola]